MIIYDVISASQIEDGDQILVDDDPLGDVTVLDNDGIEVLVVGYSYNTGDRETYQLALDKPVELWSV